MYQKHAHYYVLNAMMRLLALNVLIILQKMRLEIVYALLGMLPVLTEIQQKPLFLMLAFPKSKIILAQQTMFGILHQFYLILQILNVSTNMIKLLHVMLILLQKLL